MSPDQITSSHNNRLKQVRNLLQYAKRRRTEQRFVLEGVRLLKDALESGAEIEFALLRTDAVENDSLADLEISLQRYHVDYAYVNTDLFNELSDTDASQGVIAVSAVPNLELPAEPSLVLVLDRVADPGNLGTILRTAAATGVDGVLLTHGTVDAYNPKVVRAAMGAHFRVAVQRANWQQILESGLRVLRADAGSATSLYDTNLTMPVAIVIGAEAHGFSGETLGHVPDVISIPMVSGESLNAAMAATVIVYEAFRQRGLVTN